MQVHWEVLYDASQAPPSGGLFPVVGLLFTLGGVIATRVTHLTRDEHGLTRRVRGSRAARRFLGFAVAWTVGSALVTIGPHVVLVRALRARRFEVVEGTVDEYVGADLLRKTPERWMVSGHRYEFHFGRAHPGFDEIGVIRPGMYVRIADVGGRIARLEVVE